METVNSEDSQEQTDGVITDAILQIVIKISVLLTIDIKKHTKENKFNYSNRSKCREFK